MIALGIIQIAEGIINNWEIFVLITSLLVILSLTGTLTNLIKAAVNGLREVFTPLGLIVAAAIIYLVYQIYLSVMETL